MPVRIAPWFLILILAFAGSPANGWTQEASPPSSETAEENSPKDAEPESKARLSSLDSPRTLFETFISSWNLATFRNDKIERKLEKINTEERRTELLRAIQCLETGKLATEITPALYRQARDLIDVLNLNGRVDTAALPPAPGPPTGRHNFNLTAINSSIPLVELDERWYFEAYWLRNQLPRLLAEMNTLGLEEYEAFSVRRYVPAVLRQRALFLEHWQRIGNETKHLNGNWSHRHA